MRQTCAICKVLKDESGFNQIERNNEVRLAKSCRECNLKKYGEKTEGAKSCRECNIKKYEEKKESHGVRISTFMD